MTTYVLRNGELIEKRLAPPLHAADRSHYVIIDTMDACRHPATGKMMDSKSKFRKATRAAGCIEIGNETVSPGKGYEPSSSEIKRDIARAIDQLQSGYRPTPIHRGPLDYPIDPRFNYR